MKFNRPSLRPLVTFAAGLVVLVACQNATDSNTNSDSPLVVTAKFPISAPRVPDTATSFIQNDSVSNKLNCPPTSGSEDSTTCTATLDLPHPLGTDSVALHLWTLGVETYTLYFKESGSSTTLDLGSHSVLSLDTLLLSGFANLPASQKSTFGTGPSGLVAYYASLILANDASFAGKSLPVGMSIDSVKKDLVLQGIPAGKTLAQLTALNVGLDTASIRNIAAILVQANLLKSTDTLDWFHPVRVSAAVSIASSLTAGGGAVNVNGAFSWNPGASVTLSRIVVRTPNPGDSSTVQLSYQFNIGKTDTLWSLSSNLTLQAKSSASVGWDTLLIILSTDSTHSVTARVPFQVVAKDVTPPALILLSPAQDTAFVPNSTASFVVKALATDSGSGMDSLKIGTKTYRTAAAIADTLWDTLSLVVGANVSTVQAWDHVGNTSTATVTITRAPAPVNTKAPSITRVTPSQDTETVPWSTKSATLSWTITGDTTIASVTLNGHPLTGHVGLYQDTAILGMGPNLFILAAADAYGLGAFDTIRITRQADMSRPVLKRSVGTTDTLLNEAVQKFPVSWTVTDNALMSVAIQDSVLSLESSGTYARTVSVAKDSQWIHVVATDSSGNQSFDSILVRKSDGTRSIGSGRIFTNWLVTVGTPGTKQCTITMSDSGTVTTCTNTPGNPGSTTPIYASIHGFRMDTSLVTRSLFQAVMGPLPAQVTACTQDCPVANLSWADAIRFCNRRSVLEGLKPAYDTSSADSSHWTLADTSSGYRLPSLNEYNFAVRQGDSSLTANPTYTADLVWYGGNSGEVPHPVATKSANTLGLYDLVGNAFQLYEIGTALGSTVSTSIAGTSYLSASLAGSSAEISAAGSLPRSPEVGFRCVKPQQN
jgi:hypothetical protein